MRHDTRLLEQALQHVVRQASIPTLQAEAAALEQRNRATAIRRIATGSAVAIAAVGVGLGLFLGLWRPGPRAPAEIHQATGASPAGSQKTDAMEVTRKLDQAPPPLAPKEPTKIAAAPPPPVPSNPVTKNFSVFQAKTTQAFGRVWTIEAGHGFLTEEDQQARNWQRAWCYSTVVVDGVALSVDLASRRTRGEDPVGPLATDATLQKAGLSRLEAAFLAGQCPWLDGKVVNPGDLVAPPGQPTKSTTDAQLLDGELHVKGPINSDFPSLLTRQPFNILKIDSEGGDVDAALRAGRWLHAAGKAVHVEGQCLSACVFVLAGGRSRTAAEPPRVGVHRFSKQGEAHPRDMEVAQAKSAEIAQYLKDMGIAQDLWFAMARTPSETMTYLKHDEMIKWRLLTSAKPEAPPDIPVPPDAGLDEAPPEPNPSGPFEAAVGFDAIGNDFPEMPIRGTSLEACRAMCQSQSNCAAMTFNTAAGACFLKSQVGTLVREDVATTFVRREFAASVKVSDLTFLRKTELIGDVLDTSQPVRYPDCVIACEAKPGCQGFSYSSRSKICRLLSRPRSPIPNPDFSAGVRSGIPLVGP